MASSAFLSAAIHGMLGLEPDGRTNVLQFAPQVPNSWHSLRVEHIKVGKSVVDLDWHSDKGHFAIDLKNIGPIFHLSWTQTEAGQNAIGPAILERDIMPGNTRVSLP